MTFWILKYSDGSYAAIEWHCGSFPYKVDTLFEAIRGGGMFLTREHAAYQAAGKHLTPVKIVVTEER